MRVQLENIGSDLHKDRHRVKLTDTDSIEGVDLEVPEGERVHFFLVGITAPQEYSRETINDALIAVTNDMALAVDAVHGEDSPEAEATTSMIYDITAGPEEVLTDG